MTSAPTIQAATRIHLCWGAAMCLCVASAACAQPPRLDAEAARRERSAAIATFLDTSKTTDERLGALDKMGYPDDKTFAALLEVGRDKAQHSAVRLAALRRYRFDTLYFDAVTKILEDPADGDEDLDTGLVLDLSQKVSFTPPVEIAQRMQLVLRALMDDARARVRLQAYRALVANHDTVAVSNLSDSLRRGREVPIPLPEAIKLLDEDGAVNHLVALRPYLDHADPAVVAQAARALGGDRESRKKIVGFALNADSPQEVRVNALRSLSREDDTFPEYSLPLIEDAKTSVPVRAAAMRALAGRMNYHKVDDKTQVRFATAVESIAKNENVTTVDFKAFRSESSELLEYLKGAFPAVKAHYEGR